MYYLKHDLGGTGVSVTTVYKQYKIYNFHDATVKSDLHSKVKIDKNDYLDKLWQTAPCII